MKKQILKIVLPLLAVALVGLALATSCEKEKNTETIVETSDDVVIIDKTVPDARTTYLLYSLFGHCRIAYDSIFVVNSASELQQYINYTGPDIDFQKKTLLFGWVASPSHPSVIDSTYLTNNTNSNNYIYNVDVVVNPSGYQVIEKLYFWDIYPKINGNIVLNINYQ